MNKAFVTETLQNRHGVTVDVFRTLDTAKQRTIYNDVRILMECRFLKRNEPVRLIGGRPLDEHLDKLIRSVLWGESVTPILPPRRWVEPFSPGRARVTRHEPPDFM